MKAALATLCFLLTTVPAALRPPPAVAGDDPCATSVGGWEQLSDTSSTVPAFIIDGRVEIDRVLVCDGGVYFYFKTREWGRYMRFCLAFLRPTQEQMAQYHARQEMNPQERTKQVLAATAVAMKSYETVVGRIREILGSKFVEGGVVSFEKSRWRPELRIKLGSPMRFSYRNRTIDFRAMPDIYFVPPDDIEGWKLFLLLYPGAL